MSIHPNTRESIQFLVGLGSSAWVLYALYQTAHEDFSLSAPTIAAMLAIVVLLLYGTTELRALIDSVQGRGGSDDRD